MQCKHESSQECLRLVLCAAGHPPWSRLLLQHQQLPPPRPACHTRLLRTAAGAAVLVSAGGWHWLCSSLCAGGLQQRKQVLAECKHQHACYSMHGHVQDVEGKRVQPCRTVPHQHRRFSKPRSSCSVRQWHASASCCIFCVNRLHLCSLAQVHHVCNTRLAQMYVSVTQLANS